MVYALMQPQTVQRATPQGKSRLAELPGTQLAKFKCLVTKRYFAKAPCLALAPPHPLAPRPALPRSAAAEAAGAAARGGARRGAAPG